MKVGIIQLEPAAGEPDQNRATAVDRIEAAADAGADLVVLPELFTVGFFAFDAYNDAAEPLYGPTVETCATVAVERDVAVLTGSFVEDLALTTEVDTPADRGLANTSVLLDRDGEIVTVYRKRHLFGIGSEEASRLVPGDTAGVGRLDGHVVGITTCYDLRFPELYREYLDLDVTLMLVPSAWPDARPEHWRTLSRARAIENQWYLVAINGTGMVAGTRLLGGSVAYDPWGKPLVEFGADPDVTVVTVDPDRVADIRSDFPVLADRRVD